MNIIMVSTGLGMGGAETQIVNLADKFFESGHQVMLVALTGKAIVHPKNKGIAIVELGMTKGVLGLIGTSKRLRDIFMKNQGAVIHSHLFHAIIITRILKLFSPIDRLICTAHNTHIGSVSRRVLYRITDGLADLNTNVSQEAVNKFIEDGATRKDRMLAVTNGIDTDFFNFAETGRKAKRHELGISDGNYVFLAVGRLHEIKNYPLLLNAMRILYQKHKNIKLFIVGSGSMKDELVILRDQLGLNDVVEFLGVRTDVNKLMCACDTFVLSSRWEGFGLVVAEAMACQRMVVSTDCGGVKSVISDKGWLVEDHEPKALSMALHETIILSNEQRTIKALNARSWVLGNFSLNTVTSKWLSLYSNEI